MTDPRILTFDIETAPTLGWVWGLWKQNVGINQIKEDGYILMWSAKWLDEDDVIHDALPLHKTAYKEDRQDDRRVVESLAALLNEADVVVTHNGDRFDLPWVTSRLVYHDLPPLLLPQSVDTYKIARYDMRFTSNKLDYLAQHLGIGCKVDTGGFELWEGCMAGDPLSWRKMIEYGVHDVNLTEQVYLRLRPYARRHVNMSLFSTDGALRCKKCGSTNLICDGTGYQYTSASKFQRHECKDCGDRTTRSRLSSFTKEEKEGHTR